MDAALAESSESMCKIRHLSPSDDGIINDRESQQNRLEGSHGIDEGRGKAALCWCVAHSLGLPKFCNFEER